MHRERNRSPVDSGALQLKGIFAAVLTPMDSDLNPDHRTFAAHCHQLLGIGCHGLSVFGTTGEANSLSADERLAALEALVDGDVPGSRLLVGTGSCALTDAVRLSRSALELDAPGVLVLPPFYYKASDEGVFRFFAELIERIGDERLRIYLYHFPQMTGIGFDLSLIERLLDAYPETIAGIKDSAGDWGRIKTLCQEFPGFSVFAGTERYLLDTLRHGGAGCISATVNVTSRLARRVHSLHEAGENEEAEALQRQLTDLRATMETFPLIPVLKSLMARLTEEPAWRYLRPPLVGLDEDQEQDLISQLPASELL